MYQTIISFSEFCRRTRVSGIGRPRQKHKLVVSSPRASGSFHCLQRGTQLHENEQTRTNRTMLTFPPVLRPDTAEILQTDTSPVKVMTVFRRTLEHCYIEEPIVVACESVDEGQFVERSSQSVDGVSVSEYCNEKYDSLDRVS